jgi:hypothetical protein
MARRFERQINDRIAAFGEDRKRCSVLSAPIPMRAASCKSFMSCRATVR